MVVGALATASTRVDAFELHVVGHSARSILLGHLLTALRKSAGRWPAVRAASIHLYAPACTVAFADTHYASDSDVMERLYLDVLSDKEERGDNVVSTYRKSLPYLVSNALETDLRTPILGLDRINGVGDDGWDGSSDTGEVLSTWRKAAHDEALATRTTVVTSDRVRVAVDGSGDIVQRACHGGFDNDIDVVARTVQRITGAKPALSTDDLRGR